MRNLSLALSAAAVGAVATPALAADLTVSVEVPRLSVAAYQLSATVGRGIAARAVLATS